MMAITTDLIQKLRNETGVGIMDAKKALQETDGDIQGAVVFLKKKGQKIAAKKQVRSTNEGFIGSYVHANGKIACLVAIACESDFVAKTEDFKKLAHDIAMQITAVNPQYISPDEIPEDILAKEKEIIEEQLKNEKKPEKVIDKIVSGKLEKYYSEVCLMKQPFIKEDKKTVEELIQENVMKLGENIKIKEFTRIEL
ncbi:elongation factor Ts [Patescibacteria group bacterium]|nr:elongation factor Ts [Patescibacteria group bacterium]